MSKSQLALGLLALGIVACDDSTGPSDLPPPANVYYFLDASGDPLAPAGVLIQWDAVNDPDLEVYNVYSSRDGAVFDLRGSTTSLSFHDVGNPDLEYFVTSVDRDGRESSQSEHVVIDELLRLESPSFLSSVSLDQAIQLIWGDNPYQNEPDGFLRYRVYSSSFDLDAGNCVGTWVVEGTTVSPEFLVSALVNGVPRCFAVSAESIEGWESLWSDLRADTPRPDARNVLVWRQGANNLLSGFRFHLDANNDGVATPAELGVITSGSDPNIDFRVVDSGGDLFFEPIRVGTTVALYSAQPIEDLTSIDIAPLSGFSAVPIQASAGFGYVFEMDGGDGFARYGGVRVTHVSADYIIFDWSYQTDPGNPELSRHGGRATASVGDLKVTGARTGR